MNAKFCAQFSLVVTTFFLSALLAQADITTGLVGYWPLEDGPGSATAADGSGNGNTGTLTNYADATYNNMWTTAADPMNGDAYALLFNSGGSAGSTSFGTNTYVNIADSSSLDKPSQTMQWTLSAWVNCSVAPSSEPANAGIICKGNSGHEAYVLYMSGGHFYTEFHNAAGSGTETVNATNNLAINTWYNVTATVWVPRQSGSLAEALVYVNGVLLSGTNANTYTTVLTTNLPVTIGCRANATGTINTPFEGTIDQVRIYDRALSASDVLELYNTEASQLPPFITTQPASSATVAQGNAYTNSVSAISGSPLSYQWYTNGVALGGATGAQLIINPAEPIWNDITYDVVVANTYGAVTSEVAQLTVLPVQPEIIAQYPNTYTNVSGTYNNLSGTNLLELFAGASPTFSLSTLSATPLTYYWFTNGVLAAGVTSSNFTWTQLESGPDIVYCIASNVSGTATSAVWSASVIADPTSPYPQAVLALNPVGFWRLNEVDDNGGSIPGDGNPDALCHDYAGGNDGLYTNLNLSQPGYNPAYPDDTSALFGENGYVTDSYAGQVEGIDFSSPTNTSKAFTIEAWTEGDGPQLSAAGIVTKGWGGGGEQFDLDTGGTGHVFRFLFRDSSGGVHAISSSIATSYYNIVWYHLAGVVDEVNSNMAFYINGTLVGTAALSPGIGVLASTNPMSIGARTGSADTNYNDQYFGWVQDVSVFSYALSSNQVANEYAEAGNTAPFFTQPPPTNVTVIVGNSLTLPATAYGTPVNTYTWYDPNGNVLATGSSGGTSLNATFTTNSVPLSWNGGQLELTVNNSYGQTNVYVAFIVQSSPVITNNLPPQVDIAQGQSYTYSIGAVGAAPLHYQWFSGASPILNQTNTTYTATGPSAGTFSYSVVVTNFLGSTTSIVSALTVLPTPTSAYSANILALNPVGYWPMHEIEAAAPGDIETNYGSLGLLGTGYYVDWANLQGINHGFAGALTYDPDTSVYFPWNGGSNDGGMTNCLLIPQSSPLSALNPPFTVECWFWPTNTGSGDVWGQSGYEGLNAGSAGLGNGSVCGIRIYWNSSKFTIYTYDNSSVLNQVGISSSASKGQWHHLVVACDANTNFTEYLDGVPQSTNSGAGLYSPDYWSPMTLATSRGFTRNIPGAIDEFAVYTNDLSASDILAHYNAGTSGAADAYVSDVTNDNPVIYLRMDSPAYTPPAATLLPALVNFGSAGVNGFYTPGTMPGILPGPASTNGVPFNGLSGTNVALFSGVSSFADAGYAATYNPIGTMPISVSAMFRGNPADGRNQTIVGHSDNSWHLWMNTSGKLVWQLGTNITSLTSSKVYNDGNWHQAVAVYAPSANPTSDGVATLYVDGALDTTTVTASTNGIAPGSASDVMIASDPEYTNNPAGPGEQFAGRVCEVALFTNVLTSGEVKNLYQLATAFPGLTASLGPSNLTLYARETFTYNVQASGTLPMHYQWYHGASPISNATNASYAATAALGVTNTYSCVVSNAYNGYSVTNVGTASLAGITAPTNLYPATVLSNNPIAYWRLDETTGTVANDYVGGHDALYNNVQQGVPGYNPTADPDLAALFGTVLPTNSYAGEIDNSGNDLPNIDFSQPGGSNAEFSVEAWINGGSNQVSGAGIVTKGYGNGGEQFDLDVVQSDILRFIVRDASGNVYGAASGFALDGNWHHVAGVCDEAGGHVSLYVDGVDVTNAPITSDVGLLSTTASSEPGANLVSIGSRTTNKSATSFSSQFVGTIDEVALYNYALSQSQVAADYQAGAVSSVNTQPTNIVYSVSGNQLTLSWPQDHTGWMLQAQTNGLSVGLSNNWVNVTGSTSVDQLTIPINVSNGAVFYRLVYQKP
ncbi:MAG TPA: LamG-like jellyroll fold domain-containing protein [Candidatus Sulfotelmatobacter sp.]|nr:LamG-like jellyroll fold domain-containing protein [Candidatus Sulfotelmatobacter sp.]